MKTKFEPFPPKEFALKIIFYLIKCAIKFSLRFLIPEKPEHKFPIPIPLRSFVEKVLMIVAGFRVGKLVRL